MSRFRVLLCWLLAALLVGAGVPTRSTARCRAAAPAVAAEFLGTAAPAGSADCCAVARHCCCPIAAIERHCGCEQPEPQPAPPAPAQKQPLGDTRHEPLVTPRTAVPAPATRPVLVTCWQMPSGALPRCSRQEALSVWRC